MIFWNKWVGHEVALLHLINKVLKTSKNLENDDNNSKSNSEKSSLTTTLSLTSTIKVLEFNLGLKFFRMNRLVGRLGSWEGGVAGSLQELP